VRISEAAKRYNGAAGGPSFQVLGFPFRNCGGTALMLASAIQSLGHPSRVKPLLQASVVPALRTEREERGTHFNSLPAAKGWATRRS